MESLMGHCWADVGPLSKVFNHSLPKSVDIKWSNNLNVTSLPRFRCHLPPKHESPRSPNDINVNVALLCLKAQESCSKRNTLIQIIKNYIHCKCLNSVIRLEVYILLVKYNQLIKFLEASVAHRHLSLNMKHYYNGFLQF